MVTVKKPTDEPLATLLADHPEVQIDGESTQDRVLEIQQGSWTRSLFWGDQQADVRGLVELIDNNPIVCTDSLSVPGPMATLAAIALGPLIRANLIKEEPALHVTEIPDEPDDILTNLEILGLHQNISVGVEENNFGRVMVLNAMVEIPVMDDYSILDDLYDEAYARSFYVRRIDDQTWDTELVSGKPYAAYHLRLTPGEEQYSLLTIQVMADRQGKLGACQVIHALNVMVGNEECLGIPDALPENNETPVTA